MIRIVIIEDEELAVKRLERILSKIDKSITIVQKLSTVKDSIEFLKSNGDSIDLILIDIHLSDGISFEIFDHIEVNKPMIFTTAYDKYAVEAFKQLSVSYLLKPVQEEDLTTAIEKYEKNFQDKTRQKRDYSTLFQHLLNEETKLKKRFLVQVGDKVRSVNVEDIAIFYAENKSCFILTNSGKRYYVNYTLDKLIDILSPEDFLRVNRKVILNIVNIIELIPFSKSRMKVKVEQDPGFDIFVSADKIKRIKTWMNF